MMSFWILAAGLLGIALLFAITPMFRKYTADDSVSPDDLNLAIFKQQLEELDADLSAGNLDQKQYDASKHDLEKELLNGVNGNSGSAPIRSGRWAVGVVALAVPLLAAMLYMSVGDHEAIDRVNAAPVVAQQGEHAGNTPSMDTLVAKLAQRLETDPSMEGWIMLGRSYLAMGKDTQAVDAYGKAMQLAPKNTDAILGYAEALAKTQGGLQGEAAELIARALEIEPDNPNSLWMMGLVEFQRGDSGKAVEHWTRLESMLQPGSEDAAMLNQYIAEARQEAGLGASPAAPLAQSSAVQPAMEQPTEAAPKSSPSEAGTSVQVQVSLAPELAGKFSPQDTLFIFARALNGPPMPLAVQRLQAKDLPVSLSLDDSMAMMPQMRLSSFPEVVVGARISKSGNAIPQPGDLQGEIKPVRPGQAETVAVVIDNVRP